MLKTSHLNRPSSTFGYKKYTPESRQQLTTNLEKIRKFEPLIIQKSIKEKKSLSNFDWIRSDLEGSVSGKSLDGSWSLMNLGGRIGVKKALFGETIDEVILSNYNTHKSNQDFLEMEQEIMIKAGKDKNSGKGNSSLPSHFIMCCVYYILFGECII